MHHDRADPVQRVDRAHVVAAHAPLDGLAEPRGDEPEQEREQDPEVEEVVLVQVEGEPDAEDQRAEAADVPAAGPPRTASRGLVVAPSATALYITIVTASRNAAIRWKKSSVWYTAGGKLHERAEVLLEPGVRHRGGVHPDHLDALLGRQPGHRAEHRHPVVAARLDRRRPLSGEPSPRTTKPSSVASMSAPEAAQPLHHARDPVRLLQPQLLRAAHHGLAVGVRAEQRHAA